MTYNKKVQASIELIIILAVSLLVLGSIIVFNSDSLFRFNSQLEIVQARSLLDNIEDASTLVYNQGYGSFTKKHIIIPEGINNINISQKTITISFDSGYKTFRNYDFFISGELPTAYGKYFLEVQAMNDFVAIGTDLNNTIFIPPVCGNNILEPGEDCDNTNLDGKSCTDFGFFSGTLSCQDCKFNYSSCSWAGTFIYRMPLTISASQTIPSNYQILVHLDETNTGDNFNWDNNCNDLKFTTTNNETLPFWIQSCDSINKESFIWLKLTEEITTDYTIYMHYNLESATEFFVSDVFLADSIFLASGRCPSQGCNINDHTVADNIRSNMGVNPYTLDGSGYVNLIDHSTNPYGGANRYYLRYRFLFVPTNTQSYSFGVNSYDGSEATFFPIDGYGDGIRSNHPFGEHDIIANWYGGHNSGNCGSSGTISSRELEANKGYWLDLLNEDRTGQKLFQMCINDGSWKIVSTSNFPGQIYARSYITPEPSINYGTEEEVQE